MSRSTGPESPTSLIRFNFVQMFLKFQIELALSTEFQRFMFLYLHTTNCLRIIITTLLVSMLLQHLYNTLKPCPIIIIFYFEIVTFFHTKLGSDVCPRLDNLWRHYKILLDQVEKIAISQLSTHGYWCEFLVAGCPSTPTSSVMRTSDQGAAPRSSGWKQPPSRTPISVSSLPFNGIRATKDHVGCTHGCRSRYGDSSRNARSQRSF